MAAYECRPTSKTVQSGYRKVNCDGGLETRPTTQHDTSYQPPHALHRRGDGYWISSLADLTGVENVMGVEHLLDPAHQLHGLFSQ